MLIISALGRLWQEGNKFETSLAYIVRFCLQKRKKGKKNWGKERKMGI
jgi:hypothetical protein